MEGDYTKGSLERFLDTADRLGFFNANTLAGMRATTARLLEDMQGDDDIRKVDVEAATIRYHNKHPGVLSPNSLRTYEARLKRLIDEFIRYNQDPAGYKPYSKPAPKADAERSPRAQKVRNPVVVDQDVAPTDVVTLDAVARTTPTAMAMQYPLRDNFVAQVLLPRGMTSEEARRLCAFIRTLAVDFAPEN